MSTVNAKASADTQFVCRSCEATNSEDAKFCASCGTPLWEPCPSCGQSARIGQKFCGGCGFHLAAEFDKRLETVESSLRSAQKAIDEFDYVDAIAIAARLVNKEDPRMREFSDRAESILERARRERTEWEARVTAAANSATDAFENKDYRSIIDLLASIPDPVLTPPLRRLLATARARVSELESLRTRLKAALKEKNFLLAGGLLDQLLVLLPESAEFRELALKVGETLAQSAERRFDKGEYAAALERLEAIPAVAREVQSHHQSLSEKIDNVTWLTDQVARSPFATPTLGRLVQRLVKLAPHDERAAALLPQLAARVKGGSRDKHGLFPMWVGKVDGWKGATVNLLPLPNVIAHGNAPAVLQNPTRFAVATGLALRAIKRAAYDESIGTQSGPSGLKRLLKRRATADVGWGIDVGASALRAVKLRAEKDAVSIEQTEVISFDEPLCRASVELKAAVILREKLGELVERMGELGDIPIWTNLTSRECLGRFITLPPVGDKQVNKLLEKEIPTQFPLALDQLCYSATITGTPADGSPRAVLLAAKRQTIEQREKLFAEVGITLSGMQPDPVALHNYACFEFEELLGEVSQASATPDAVCLVDGGATGITVYLGTRDSFWFRFIDGGGEDLTTKLAAALSLTHQQAEAGKRNPAEISALANGMRAVELRISQSAVRLMQCFEQAEDFLGDIRLPRIFCVGGVPLTHGWVRHTFAQLQSPE